MSFRLLLFGAALYLSTATSTVAGELVLPLGVTRTFACTSPHGTDYVIIWLVNGTSAAHSEFQDYIDVGEEVHLDSDVLQRNLTFTAETTANNTHIQCDIYSLDGEQYTSLDLNITLQGTLSPPAVDMARDQHSVVFSWSVPFTLNISDMEPDILHYVVYIIRDDGHNDTVNTTDTHYELQADPCQSHQYHVEIAAVNVVGEGEKSRSPEISLKAYANVTETKGSVFFVKGNPVIKISLKVTSNCSNGMTYSVKLHGQFSNDVLVLLNHTNYGTKHIMFTSDNVKRNELYNYSVEIEGKPMLESPRPMLSTFDVQHVEIDHQNEYVSTTCHFAQGSHAKGCKIKVETQEKYDSSSPCEFFASRTVDNQANVTFRLSKGTYTIMVHDEEHDSTVSTNPAWNTTIFLYAEAEVTECEFRSESNSSSTNMNLTIWIIPPVLCILFVIGVTAIVTICVYKRKGKHGLPDVEMNDYCNPPSVQKKPMRSHLSSESSDCSSRSDSLEQSSGSSSAAPLLRVSGHSQYADLQVTKHTSAHPPPSCNDEPVNYATLQFQKATAQSHQPQGYVDTGVPGPYTPDDVN